MPLQAGTTSRISESRIGYVYVPFKRRQRKFPLQKVKSSEAAAKSWAYMDHGKDWKKKGMVIRVEIDLTYDLP